MERNLKKFKNDCIEKYFSSYQKYLENVFLSDFIKINGENVLY